MCSNVCQVTVVCVFLGNLLVVYALQHDNTWETKFQSTVFCKKKWNDNQKPKEKNVKTTLKKKVGKGQVVQSG